VGVGTGVRWRSPVGRFEAAIAYGVQPRKFRLHLTAGFVF
jgi:translocation and assembly module TamA